MLNLLCSFCSLHSAEVHDRESIQALLASLKTEQLTKHLHDFPSSPRILKYTPNVKMTNTPVWFKKNWNKNVLKSAKNESCSRGTEGIHPECYTILKQNDRVPSLPNHNLLLYISHTHKYIHSHIPSVIIWRRVTWLVLKVFIRLFHPKTKGLGQYECE